MKIRYEAKHYNNKQKINFTSKFVIALAMIIMLVLNSMSGILSVFTDSAQTTNKFTLAPHYTVHFDANTGTGTMSDQIIFRDTDTSLKTNEFTKQDYLFLGWNTQANGEGTDYEDEQSVRNLAAINGTITLYAQWEEILGVAEVNGIYYETLAQAIAACGGTSSNPATTPTTIRMLCDVEENITIPKGKNIILNLDSHTLSNSSDANGLVENKGTLVITNGTLTKNTTSQHALINNNPGARVEIVDATLTSRGTNKAQALYNNGGTAIVSGNSVLTSESTNRATINTLNSSGNTGRLIITGGTIISPKQSAVTCAGGTVTIGTQGAPAETTGPVLQGKIYGMDNATNNGVYFYDGICKGQTRGINQTIPTDRLETGCTIVTGTESPYKTAYLEPNNTIEFDANSGTTDEPIRYRDTGAQLGTLPTATREGYTFVGWFTDPSGGTQISENTIVSGDDTYYAHWVLKKQILFNANGGTVDEAMRYIDDGAEIGDLPVPVYAEHRFDGWFTDPTGGTQITSTTVITADDEFYAHWTEIFTVQFDANGGRVSETKRDVEQGEQVGSLPTPTRTSSTFLGWFTERTGGTQISASTTVTEDVTYYAHWNGPNVAKVGDVYYPTLQDAVNSAEVGGPQIRIELLVNVTENIIIAKGQNVEFDFGSYTLTAKSKSSDAQAVYNNGTLTITSGTITSSLAFGTINNEPTGTLIMTGGRIEATGSRQAIYNEGGVVEISGTAYLSSTNLAIADRDRGTIQNLNSGTVTVKGGTIVATKETAICNEDGTIIIGENDGTVSTTSPLIQGAKIGIRNNSVVKFYDGIIKVPSGKTLIIGTVSATPQGYEVVNGTESSNITAYLSNEIPIPTAITGLVYDGTAQSGVAAGTNATTLTGNTATQAGSYTATASLKYPAISTWSDGTTTNKTITYTIAPATVTPEAIVDDKVYDGTTTGTGTISLTGVVSGDAVTAAAASYTFASPDVGTDITVTASGITISGADASNYQLSSTTATTTADITSE